MEDFQTAVQGKKKAKEPRGIFSHQDRKKGPVKLALFFSSVFLALGALVTLAPILWMILGSFKTPSEIYSIPQTYLPKDFSLGNFQEALRLVDFDRYFLNSLFICACEIVGQLLICSMAAYALSKLRVRFAGGILLLFMTSLMVPFEVLVIP